MHVRSELGSYGGVDCGACVGEVVVVDYGLIVAGGQESVEEPDSAEEPENAEEPKSAEEPKCKKLKKGVQQDVESTEQRNKAAKRRSSCS